MKKIRNIVVIGPQGSGKDTQSEMLSKEFNYPFIVMSDLFRQEIKRGSKIGRKVSRLIKQGKLAPDSMALALLKKRLKQKDSKKGYILNGFPRNIKQAKALDKITKIDLVLELFISDKEAVKRLSGRRFCPVCSATYHIKFKPPKKRGICDLCGSRLMVREDDKPGVIKKRLLIYHQQTEPVLDYYRQKGIYLWINGEQPISDVFKEIKKKIKAYKNDNHKNSKRN